MKKILIVGDSHAGAVKLGIDILTSENNLNFEVDFCAVGSRYGMFESLEIKNKRLILPEKYHKKARNSPVKVHYYMDKDEFFIDEYDEIIVTCGGKSPNPIDIRNYQCNCEFTFSSGLLLSIILNMDRYKKIVSTLNRLCPEKLIIIGAPPPSSLDPSSTAIIKNFRSSYLLQLYEQILNCCSGINNLNRTRFLLPPMHLLSESLFQVKSKFMLNASLKNGGHDYRHANELYGTEIVKALSHLIAPT